MGTGIRSAATRVRDAGEMEDGRKHRAVWGEGCNLYLGHGGRHGAAPFLKIHGTAPLKGVPLTVCKFRLRLRKVYTPDFFRK